jgi:hypothetical protein
MKSKYLVIAAAFVLSLSIPISAYSTKLKIEGESYTSTHDIAGNPIMSGDVGGCSGGYALLGMDWPGEWVNYVVTFDTLGYYSTSVVCKGSAGITCTLKATFFPIMPGESQSVFYSFVGSGISG